MPDTWVIAGYVLIPFAFGLVPGLLPRRLPQGIRWTLWLALLAMSAAYVGSLQGEPDPFQWLALVPFGLASLLSLILLLGETRRAGRTARRDARPTR